jgi:hypothetical protein
MIPEGKYFAKGIAAQLTSSSEKGTPGVQVIVEIIEGEHAGERLRWDGWLTEKTEQRTLESLRTLGWSTDMLDDLQGIGATECSIIVEHEQGTDGKNYARVQWINKIGGAKLKEDQKMSASAAKQLAQRFQSKARGIAKSGATPAKAPAKPAEKSADPGFEDGGSYGDSGAPF